MGELTHPGNRRIHYRHQVTLPHRAAEWDTNRSQPAEHILDWGRENLTGLFTWVGAGTNVVWSFSDIEDAVLFRIRWR